MVLEAYEAGQRDFGENYIQELVEKSNHSQVLERCTEIRWHFIGHLQSNKSKKLNSIPRLASVQTVDSKKLAGLINKEWEQTDKLNVFVQVNTSGEESKLFDCFIFYYFWLFSKNFNSLDNVKTNLDSIRTDKSGVKPDELVEFVRWMREKCDRLQFKGLMTIGALATSLQRDENEDFDCLVACRSRLAETLDIVTNDVGAVDT